ncbi:MAG: lipase, partial [Aldersonia sp.]|nr:lipase [Aldersonia sp.]
MARPGIRSVVIVLCTAAIAAVVAAPHASADPFSNLIRPPQDDAALYPSPLSDPWFVPPAGYESSAPGTVLNRRPVTVVPLLTAVTSTQLLVRSTNSKGAPVPIATTVIVPSAPWTGPGARPVVAYNTAIDSLGLTCVPSWTLPQGNELEIFGIQAMLAKNYAVVVTDYQGPRQAYA